MIISFGDKTTRDVYDDTKSRYSRGFPTELLRKTQRLLDQIHTAPSLGFLCIPPGNNLEKLSGKLQGCWSVRINDQWRIIFQWKSNDAYEVQIIDYH